MTFRLRATAAQHLRQTKVVCGVAPGGAGIGFPPQIEQGRSGALDSGSEGKPENAIAAILRASLEEMSLLPRNSQTTPLLNRLDCLEKRHGFRCPSQSLHGCGLSRPFEKISTRNAVNSDSIAAQLGAPFAPLTASRVANPAENLPAPVARLVRTDALLTKRHLLLRCQLHTPPLSARESRAGPHRMNPLPRCDAGSRCHDHVLGDVLRSSSTHRCRISAYLSAALVRKLSRSFWDSQNLVSEMSS
jgi:hypothetical protein